MTTIEKTSLSAPSRIHFGLISIGDRTKRKYGGAGLMIDQPRTLLSIAPSDRLMIDADDSTETVRKAVENWQKSLSSREFRDFSIDDLPFRMSVTNVARHCGLGSGTQLAFAIAACLQVASKRPLPSAHEMAVAMGRGKRSAIGSYGFLKGGFLVDRGVDGELVAPLDMRVDFPEEWKIVLIEPKAVSPNVYGKSEKALFANLEPTTQAQAEELQGLLRNQIVPAVLDFDFSRFATAITQFGRMSGMYYQAAQGGPYASQSAQCLVDRVLQLGEFAVGQSSWGPTLFAIGPSEKAANWLVEKLLEGEEDDVSRVSIVSADNVGMRIE